MTTPKINNQPLLRMTERFKGSRYNKPCDAFSLRKMDLKIVKLWKKERERAERERAPREIESREKERAERKRAQRQSCQLLEEREERKSQLWKDLENIRLYV